jgi:organic radical activating enzyme
MTNKYTTCPAIDMALFLNTDGGIKVCCAGEGELGNIKDQTITDIFNSPKVIEIKKSLDNHEFPTHCNRCVEHENTAPGSSQLHHFNNSKYPDLGYRKLQSVDLRWSNHCNLSCKYCGPEASSVWAKIREEDDILLSNRGYTDTVLEEIVKNVDTIGNVMLLGGEPLLQKENEALLNTISESTRVSVLTNASVDLEKNKIYNLLKKRSKNVEIYVSVDNIEERFEYVRYGAKWDLFVKNLHTLKKDFGHIRFNPVYSIWSATRLQELMEFFQQFTTIHDTHWSLIVSDPGQGFSVFEHSDFIKKAALTEISLIEPLIKGSKQYDFFQGVKKSINSSEPVNGAAKSFKMDTWYFETKMPYPKTLRELWPELIHGLK